MNMESPHFCQYVCAYCGHVVYSKTKPEPMKWKDNHVCLFVRSYLDKGGKTA